MFQKFVQNQTLLPTAPCEPQFSVMFDKPGTVKCASLTVSIERTSPVARSKPQALSTNCSPRLNTLVCVQPMGRGAAPDGRVPLTLSTYRPKLSFVPGSPLPFGPPPGGFCGVGVIVSCDDATGICTNE